MCPHEMPQFETLRRSYNLDYLFELFADEGECFVDGVGVTSHRHDPLGARTVADVDLGATLPG